MSAVIGALRVTLGADTAAFTDGLKGAQRTLNQVSKQMQAIGGQMTKVGKRLSIGVSAPLTALGVSAFQSATSLAEANAQIAAGLKSMGDASGKTAGQLQASARELQGLSTFDDSEILGKVTANLLTFGNISGEVFDRAQQAALDLSTRMDQDLKTSTIQIAKALNDPIKGVGALSEVGIQFTQQQRDMIAAMQNAGNIAGAQRIILQELERQYGGSAKAARDAAPGSDEIDAWRDFNDTVGKAITDVLPHFTAVFNRVLSAFNGMDDGTKKIVIGVGAAAVAFGPLLAAVGGFLNALGPVLIAVGKVGPLFLKLGPIITGLVPVLATVGKALIAFTIATGPIGLIIAAVAAVAIAWAKWDEIEPIVRRLYEAVRGWIIDKLNAVFDWLKAKLTAVGDWFGNLYDRVVGNSYIPDLVEEIGEHIGNLDNVMVDPIEAATGDAADAFGGMSRSIVSDIEGIVRAFKTGDIGGIIEGIAGAIGGGGGGTFGKIVSGIGSIFGGGRAMGGPVKSGTSYLVGERGPELFTPGASGSITPNNKLGMGAINISVDARGSTDPAMVRQQARLAVLEAAPAIVQAAQGQTLSAATRRRLPGGRG